jgi:hypothetical protein
MGETFLFISLGATALAAAYCIGRVDGYWKRAEEERCSQMQKGQA